VSSVRRRHALRTRQSDPDPHASAHAATGQAGVAFGVDITTTANQATVVGSTIGFVFVNRSCGRSHTFTNSNALALDLTYEVEGTSETGAAGTAAGTNTNPRCP
jgi:hypothetical protein